MPNVGRNVRLLRQQLGMTLAQLSEKSGVDLSNLSKLERGLVGYSKETLLRVSIALGVNEQTLFTEESIEDAVEMSGRRIPVLTSVQAANWKPGIAYPTTQPFLLVDLRTSRNSFAFVIGSDAMLPVYSAGDLCIVDPDEKPLPGDIVVASVDGQDAIGRQYRLKGYNKHHQEIVELVPSNSFYPTVSSEHDSIRIIGTVCEHRRFRRLR